MKKISLAISVLLISVAAFAQKRPPITAPVMPIDTFSKIVSYQGVVQQAGVSKSELYKRAMKWAKDYYPNMTQAIQEMDSVAGKISGKASFDVMRTLKDGKTAPADRIKYTITLSFKEGKYRYEITNINIAAQSYLPIEKYFDPNADNHEDHFNSLNKANDTFNAMVKNLKDRMSQPSERVKKDDW